MAKIKKFVEQYNDLEDSLKGKFLAKNLEIKSYVPFIMKNTLAQKIVDVSTFVFEDYKKADGSDGRRKINEICVNSVTQYLLFCRVLIETYTNLEVETEGFFEEYDLLKQSGLLDILISGGETQSSLIPANEIIEFKTILDMKQRDLLTNTEFNQKDIFSKIKNLIDYYLANQK